MGENINNYPTDYDVNAGDFLLGSDYQTGKTYSYPIQTIIDLIAVSGTSIVGINIVTVQETETHNFIQVVNGDITNGIIFNTGDVGFFDVYSWKGNWKASYLLIKNSAVSITYGSNHSQLVEADLMPIRIDAEMSQATSASNIGGGISLINSNDNDNYNIILKGLVEGDNTEVVQEGDNIRINYTGDIGEANTLSNAESTVGNISLSAAKSGSILKVKTLNIIGGRVTNGSTIGTVVIWERKSKSASFILSETDSNTTFWMKNVTNITVTVPEDLPADFECAFYQKGVSQVKFITSGTASLLGGKNAISAQYGSCWLETDPDSPTEVSLQGDLILV